MWTIDDLLQGTNGALIGRRPASGQFSDFSIDSRTIKKDDLFIALSGPNFDGHDYVEQTFKKGVTGAVVSSAAFEKKRASWSSLQSERFFVLVDDPLLSLQNLGRWHRKRFTLPLIAVTGSNGKTTTKEMIAAILAQGGSVLKNEGNLNNHIGLPLSLLRLREDHSAAVLELGISGKGEMALLCDIAGPTIGLITNIGSAHLEGLGSLKGVALEKGVLFEHIAEEGLAVINKDDPHLKPWEARLPRTWTFGLDPDADVSAGKIVQTEGKTSFTLRRNRIGDEVAGISLATPGLHQVKIGLAAAAVASALDVGLKDISEGLQCFKPLPQRTEIIKKKDVTILFDAYNANPDSVCAALDLLINTPIKGKRIALLGEMLELGPSTKAAHFEIGQQVARLGVDRLIAVGPSSEEMGKGARNTGMPMESIVVARDIDEAKASLTQFVHAGDLLLMKASRGMCLERLLEGFPDVL